MLAYRKVSVLLLNIATLQVNFPLSKSFISLLKSYPALDLMKNKEVQAIIGPQSSTQARFVIELGRKAQVPIISFSATSPSLSPSQNPFFIRTTHDDSAQVKAIVDIVKAFGWWEIVLIYEDRLWQWLNSIYVGCFTRD